MNVSVVDYDAGNLRSVETALRFIGTPFSVTADPDTVASADAVIVPGVGEARAAMETVRRRGLDQALVSFFATGKPMLGICIGAQLVLERSEENDTECLGLVPGWVRRFESRDLKVPHMGWNTVRYDRASPGAFLFKGIPQDTSFYFVHSYYPEPEHREAVIARSRYGVDFAAAICRDNLVATQFHPEKSGEWGLTLLDNFVEA